MEPLHCLSNASASALASALRSGRLTAPFESVAVARYCTERDAGAVAGQLQKLEASGLKPEHVALLIETIVQTRSRLPGIEELVDLVWTGPDISGTAIRDTGVVVRQLFSGAEREVLVAGFAVYQGREVFRDLARRMDERPDLRARLYLDVRRGPNDPCEASATIKLFAERFQTKEWPGTRTPELFYDPRSLDQAEGKRSSLHAKCIAIDRKIAFVTSANFTQAAQTRNIEVGALIRSERFAARLVEHFERLAAAGLLKVIAGLAEKGKLDV